MKHYTPPTEGVKIHHWCNTCGKDFHSTHAFDMHRVGAYEKLVDKQIIPSTRRCLTQAEMLDAGMVNTTRGWVSRSNPTYSDKVA